MKIVGCVELGGMDNLDIESVLKRGGIYMRACRGAISDVGAVDTNFKGERGVCFSRCVLNPGTIKI